MATVDIKGLNEPVQSFTYVDRGKDGLTLIVGRCDCAVQSYGMECGGTESATRCHVAVWSTRRQPTARRFPVHLRHHQHAPGPVQ